MPTFINSQQIDPRAIQQRIEDLPSHIRKHLGSEKMVQIVSDVEKKYQLTEEEGKLFLDFIRKVFFKDIPLSRATSFLKNHVLPPSVDAKKFFKEIGGKFLIPIPSSELI